mmetsp:Transcript_61837/g.128323  ORF Transcript_61837/g.128323 Transcript_61837/m.128323 type:complete len:208 (+) Transcript_61837:1073-1696(+)
MQTFATTSKRKTTKKTYSVTEKNSGENQLGAGSDRPKFWSITDPLHSVSKTINEMFKMTMAPRMTSNGPFMKDLKRWLNERPRHVSPIHKADNGALRIHFMVTAVSRLLTCCCSGRWGNSGGSGKLGGFAVAAQLEMDSEISSLSCCTAARWVFSCSGGWDSCNSCGISAFLFASRAAMDLDTSSQSYCGWARPLRSLRIRSSCCAK